MVKRRDYSPEVKAAARRAAGDGLFDATEFLLETANRTVPHDEGHLERSGAASVDRQNLVGVVSYDTPYAVRQHEEMSYRHPNGRRAKWLELTLQEQSPAIERYLAQQIAEALK